MQSCNEEDTTKYFIELYQKLSVLWDPNSPKCYKLHKHGPWKDIAKDMGTVSGGGELIFFLSEERERKNTEES